MNSGADLHRSSDRRRRLRPASSRRVWLRSALAVLLCLLLGSGTAPAAPTPTLVLAEDFEGPDQTFVSESTFYGRDDRGLSENSEWFADSGLMRQEAGAGRTDSEVFRMWTRRTDLAFATVSLDVVFQGWAGGDEPWHGVNLWLNESLCTPAPDCSLIDDDGGVSGYAMDFVNRDGNLTILKKAAGDTRDSLPGSVTAFVQEGTYYELARTRWSPEIGQQYELTGEALDLGDDRTLLRTSIDGDVVLEVVDDGSVGGPRLTNGGRVGVRSDFADVEVSGLRIAQ